MNINILILVCIIALLVLLIVGINYTDNFIIYEGTEYSDKLSVENIKNLKLGQKKLTNLLREFDRICRKHNIDYWCDGGTLLGVVRHKGWIPWDGDIDIALSEKDYEKLSKIIQYELPSNMWFQDRNTDANYKSDIGKIRDLNSCYIEYTNNGGTQWHNGLQLDIFIYKNNKVEGKKFNEDIIYPLKKGKFEDIEVSIPNNSHKYLTIKYGDYMKLLDVQDRLPHEGIIDATKTCDFHYDKYSNLHKK
tara:strand:- start:17363 stop:18106 length:744 start_codon:yes stop_codon:yes gene_type:complete